MDWKQAKLKYIPNKAPIMIEFGEYVICTVTGEKIAVEDLRYWSVEHQEAYKDAHAAVKRKLEKDAKTSNP